MLWQFIIINYNKVQKKNIFLPLTYSKFFVDTIAIFKLAKIEISFKLSLLRYSIKVYKIEQLF